MINKVFFSNASLIVMVTQTRELGRPKCEDYWPEEAEPVYFNNPDFLTVRLLSEEQEKEGLIARVLQFKSEDGSTRNVNHIQFVDWPDHGVPHDPAHFLTFLRRIRELKKESGRIASERLIIN
jgi:protein tyrosine phosphatase